jgi:hypothetical protein
VTPAKVLTPAGAIYLRGFVVLEEAGNRVHHHFQPPRPSQGMARIPRATKISICPFAAFNGGSLMTPDLELIERAIACTPKTARGELLALPGGRAGVDAWVLMSDGDLALQHPNGSPMCR